jgi:type IX secretion system PorP/SprF family membrane protein
MNETKKFLMSIVNDMHDNPSGTNITMVAGRFLLVILSVFSFSFTSGQEIPLNPISYKLFTPFLFNPAIAGSKDFFSTDVMAGFRGKHQAQIISGNTRLVRKVPGNTASGRGFEFTGTGVGGAIFNEVYDSSRTAGFAATGSYHLALDNRALSFVSAGVSVRGFYHHYNGNPDLGIPEENHYFPNIDAGLYYYNPFFYAGLSGMNLLGRPSNRDTLSTWLIPATPQYFFIAGFKLVLSRSLDIVIEPSVIIVTDDSLSLAPKRSIKPALRLYAGDFCIGTYFNDFERVSFLFQFRYPRFYIGTFFELPKNTPFYKQPLTTEVAFGLNLSKTKAGYSVHSHW